MQAYSGDGILRRNIFSFLTITGIIFTLIEIISYIILFTHITHHNNNIAINILQPSVIEKRNASNAISLFGLFISWLIDLLYIFFTGLLFTAFESEWIREFSSLFINIEFVFIPWIQISTSTTIIRFVKSSSFKDN